MEQEIFADFFAGGGGVSKGMEWALGRSVDLAVNHDLEAIAMHKVNHPGTEHYAENIWKVDPVAACAGRPVALAWFSPDCRHYSRAKGNAPLDKKVRGLPWVVLKWAAKVRPRMIIVENVEEFKTWGRIKKGKPIKSQTGRTFRRWIKQLVALGYEVRYQLIAACDVGAPTTRVRLCVGARCDGKPIVFPEQTHADKDTLMVRSGMMKPYRTAGEIINFSVPARSIFTRKRPLVENTMRRIARGINKFVLKNPEPLS